MDETEDSNVHSSKKGDPEYLVSLLDKYVKVDLIKSTSFNGYVHSIDPITESMILSVPCKETFQTTLIPGYAIQEITETLAPEDIKPPLRKQFMDVSEEEIILRKKKLIAWFKKNLLPVTEDGNNVVVGSANILPPYSTTNIYAENPVVILQIKNIVEKMPDNLEL